VYVHTVHGTLNADEYVKSDVVSHVVPIPTILYCVEEHHAHQSLHDNVVDTSLTLHVDQFGVIVVVGNCLSILICFDFTDSEFHTLSIL
jgi:hypothetical protein